MMSSTNCRHTMGRDRDRPPTSIQTAPCKAARRAKHTRPSAAPAPGAVIYPNHNTDDLTTSTVSRTANHGRWQNQVSSAG